MTKNEVLKYLSDNPGGFASGQSIADALGLSRTAVWKAVDALREDGYVIESVRAKGYRLVRVPDMLGEREILLGLSTRFVGRSVRALGEVDSTNTLAMRLASEGAPDGTVVVADSQTGGRGRLGRSWVSPPGRNIYASVILRPGFPPSRAPLMTLAASVALCRAVNGSAGLDARIKWPNDILVGGKKLAGILTEMSAGPDRIRHVVIGMGVNVNSLEGDMPKEVAGTACSLRTVTGSETLRAGLLGRILGELESVYDMMLDGGTAGVLDGWRWLSETLGRRVRVAMPDREIIGLAVDIDPSGALVLELPDGVRESVSSGDVTHLR